jgi:sulfide:quinone oxidoreductase
MLATNSENTRRRVVVAGGGIAGLEAVLALHALASDRLDVTLVSSDDELAYRPLSVAEPFGLGDVRRYDVAHLASEHGAAFNFGFLDRVDPERRIAHLSGAREVPYDDLIVALGADRRPVFRAALTFVDQRSTPGYRDLLAGVERGEIRSLAFVVPSGPVWPFPLYELALMTATFAAEHDRDVDITIVTPASAPLSLFGAAAEQAMDDLLTERGITVRGGYDPEVRDLNRVLLLPDGPAIEVDRVVALPRLFGPRVAGLPSDLDGFIPVDDRGRVNGVDGVWAAGDCTTFPVKQGGIATQQADVVAAAVAVRAGASVDSPPFEPVLRGVLLTGRQPAWMRTEMDKSAAQTSTVSSTALWWPPSKVAGRYLAPALGTLDDSAALADPELGVAVEVRLETRPAQEAGGPEQVLVSHTGTTVEPQLVEFVAGGHGL